MKVDNIENVWVVQYTGIPGEDIAVAEEKLFNIYNIADN